MKTTGNTILIAGGSSGIGLGLAQRFHQAGNEVVIAGRREELIEQITADNPGMHGVVLDVSDPASIAAARAVVAEKHPGVNVLINMAGMMGCRKTFATRSHSRSPSRPSPPTCWERSA